MEYMGVMCVCDDDPYRSPLDCDVNGYLTIPAAPLGVLWEN